MSILGKLFGFRGRLRRGDFWLYMLGLWAATWALTATMPELFAPITIAGAQATKTAPSLLSFLVFGGILWSTLAVYVKRCHDRGKSGWWLLLLLIPGVGFIWWLIDLGFLDSKPGPNKYGDTASKTGHEGAGKSRSAAREPLDPPPSRRTNEAALQATIAEKKDQKSDPDDDDDEEINRETIFDRLNFPGKGGAPWSADDEDHAFRVATVHAGSRTPFNPPREARFRHTYLWEYRSMTEDDNLGNDYPES